MLYLLSEASEAQSDPVFPSSEILISCLLLLAPYRCLALIPSLFTPVGLASPTSFVKLLEKGVPNPHSLIQCCVPGRHLI